MNKHLSSFLSLFAVLVSGISPGFSSATPSVHRATHFVGYFEQDPDSDVQTDPDSDGNYDLFYDRLASDGQWFNDDDYGYVWQPNVAVSNPSWRPYADGRWVWTDRGWFWQSNENFGWATYHYGRWNNVDGVGWVWVPGQQWAPSWVSWRHTDDDDYVGWAPLPAESTFSVSVGVHPWADSYYDIGPAAYAFIRIVDFARPSYREYCLPPQESLGFYNRTRNVTNITYNNNVINSYGPQYERVSQLVHERGGQQLPSYKINYAAQRETNAAFKTSVQGNQLNVLAPPPKLRPNATVKPQVTKELGRAQVDRGWRNVPEAQAKEFRQQSAQQTPVPQNLPAKPVLPPKPQIQAVTKGGQSAPNEPGKGPPASNGQLKPFIQKPENKAAGEPQKIEPPTAKAVQPESVKPGEQPKRPPVVTQEKAPPAAGGQLKPFIEKPENKAAGAQQKIEPGPAETVQPQNVKPAEPPKKPPVVTEEKKAEPATIPTQRPKPTEVQTGAGEHPQPKTEAVHPAETVKPPGHESAPQHQKEEPKKVPPPPPATSSHQNEQRPTEPPSHAPQPEVAEAHVTQPHPPQPPASQPHPAQAPHPIPNPPPQVHKPPSNNNEKKKEERPE
jgi:hypothetical protein